MNCPHCQTTALMMSERQGVEIDYCPQCRGVWLDRGELDKLIERSASMQPAAAAPAPQRPAPQMPPSGWGQPQPYYGKKPKSWLSEIFD